MEDKWNIIPIIKNSKRPAASWKEYQNKIFPYREMVYYEPCNEAVICGKISNNLVILDFDFEGKPKFNGIIGNLKKNFPEAKNTLISMTPHGLHIYFYIKDGECPRRQTQLKSPFPEIKHVDILGEGGYALIPPSIIDDGFYIEIDDVKTTTISREYFDKILKFYTLNPDEEEVMARRSADINLNKFREPFRHILEGKLDVERVAKETHQKEFVYWKFLFIEGIKAGYRPEQLYPTLRKTQPSFDIKKTEEQVRHHIKISSRPMTNDKMGIYFPNYKPDEELEDWLIIAKQLKQDFDLITMDDSEQIMVRKGNIYTLEVSNFLYSLGKLLEDSKGGKGYNRKRSNIFQNIRDTTRFNRKNFCFDKWLINFKNGYYDIKRDTFFPYQEYIDKLFCYEIPHEYIKGRANCPRFKKILSEWLGEDNPITIDDVFEMVGYTMTMNTNLKMAFFIFGNKNSGKTTFQNILEYIIGTDNRVGSTLQRLGLDQFGTDNLQFKILNMVGDMGEATVQDLSVFKLLTGGDIHIQAEIKKGNKFNFRNMIKIWYNANYIPKVANQYDDAFYSRWLLVNFPNYFPLESNTTIKDLDEEICENENEINGIIHEALKGAKRLMKRGYFRIEIIRNTEHIWKYNSDDLYAFLSDSCIKDAEESIPAKEFHDEYNIYLYKKRKKPLSPYKIKEMLMNHGIFKLRSGIDNDDGYRGEFYNGIGWKSDKKPKTLNMNFD